MIRRIAGKIRDRYRTRRLFRWAADVLVVLALVVLIAVAHGLVGGIRSVMQTIDLFGSVSG